MVTTTRRITLDELERGGGPEGLWEVIDGEIVEMPPGGGRHGRIEMKIGFLLGLHVYPNNLGFIYGPDTGFVVKTDPLTLRVPDVGFVRTERLPLNFDDGGFLRVAPDLVVEVISPADRLRDVQAKAAVWLDAGATLVWLVDPVAQTVSVYRPDGSPQLHTSEQALDAGDILPGLMLSIRDFFA